MVVTAGSVYVTMRQLGRVGVAYGFHFAREKQVDACHRMVEVEFYLVETYPGHSGAEVVAFLVGQRQYIADFQQTVGDFPIRLKHVFGHFHDGRFVVFAVCVGSCDAKGKVVASLEAGQVFFKTGNHHTDAVDEAERLAALG